MISDAWHRTVAVRCLLAMTLVPGCSQRVLTPQLYTPDHVPTTATQHPTLKVHMKSGELFTLDAWRVVDDGRRLEGTGNRYSLERQPLGQGPASIAVDDVALFETNRPEKVGAGGAAALAVMTTVTGTVAAFCVASPKSCFGSCPTFYVEGEGDQRPLAEGFSASIARALEARDIDALRTPGELGPRLVLTMRNEAFETHAVRRVGLLVVPRPPDGRVLAGVDGLFYPAIDLVAARTCGADEGDCLAPIASLDGAERASLADPHDLATRETVEIGFARAQGNVGLVVAGRQTLLSTHLFYQTMAYFGTHAGELLASMERGGPALASRAMGMARVLGGVDAEVSEGDGPWRPIGTFDEPGPIAGDVQVIPFEATGAGHLRVRLRQAKGHWRLDQVAVARLGSPLTPRRLEPVRVQKGSRPDPRALDLLRRDDRHLVTSPGDTYQILFDLPHAPNGLEIFLESEGYYYEWMREEWLAEEDAQMASLILADPREALRQMAGPFKLHEPGLERAFWASRFRK